MTISSVIRKAGPYIGNGSALTFPFGFKVFNSNEIEVVRLEVAEVIETTLIEFADYTVELNQDQNSNPGGSITLVAGPLATGFNLVITSDVENLQPTDLTNQGGFYPEVINDALDRATIQIQQLEEKVSRSAKVPITSASDAEQLVAAIVRISGSVDNIDTVSGSIGNVNLVGINIVNVNTVATNILDVNTTAASIASVNTVAANLNTSNTIGTVAASIANVNIAAGSITNVNAVAASITDVNTVATDLNGADTIGIAAANMAAILSAPTQAGIATTQAGIATTEANRAKGYADSLVPEQLVNKDSQTGAAILPTGTIAQRPATPTEGMFRRNSETGSFEGYDGTSWGPISGGATGGGINQVFVQNDIHVTDSYTLPVGKNASTAGPIIIDDGVTITISEGSTWVIV